MSITECKESIKQLVDSTENESLLKHLKQLLDWDVKHQDEVEFSDEEQLLVEEGLAEY